MCDYWLLDRDSERMFSDIYNGRFSSITKDKILEQISFIYCNKENLSRKVYIYDYDKCFVLESGQFPEKAFSNYNYKELQPLKTVSVFFNNCVEMLKDEKIGEYQKIAIRLLSSKVAEKLFKNYFNLRDIQSIFNK